MDLKRKLARLTSAGEPQGSGAGLPRGGGATTRPGGVAPGGVAPGELAAGALAPGGLARGGLAPGGLAPGGLAPGGLAAGGLAAGGLAADGLAADGLAADGLAAGGLAADGLGPGAPGSFGLAKIALARGAAHPAGSPDDLSRDARQRRLDRLRSQIDAVIARDALRVRRPAPASEPTQLPTVARGTAAGPLHVWERRYPLDHRHGSAPVRACLAADPAHVAKLALDPELATLDLQGLLFFDLETTGLAGGTGTLPFLVGLGFFEGDELVLEQLFLRRPGEEQPILRHLAERVSRASALVSFNGKSFDWPLLRARFVLGRLPPPEPSRHIDLLHCARRVFRERLPQMRLGHLEREVLGFERAEDIDSSLIPATYFAYLRDGDASGLVPVFDHNAHDLVALAAILGRLVDMFDRVGDHDPRDHLGLADVARRAGDDARALAFASAAADHPSGRYATSGLTLAADLHRRHGDFSRAAELLERALTELRADSADAPAIRLRLAKLYEHKLGELARALAHASGTVPAEDAPAQERRLARLARRLGRGSA